MEPAAFLRVVVYAVGRNPPIWRFRSVSIRGRDEVAGGMAP